MEYVDAGMQNAQNTARVQAQLSVAGKVQRAPGSALEAPIERALQLTQAIQQLTGRIEQRADRLYGSVPESNMANGSGQGSIAPGGDLGRLHEALTMLESSFSRLSAADDRLSSL